jgi:hypothetical protein
MKIQVSHHYRSLREPVDQFNFGTEVSAGVFGNSSTFITPPFTQIIFDGINNTFKAKIDAAAGGDHDAIVARDTYRDATWIPAMDKMADYVNNLADGNVNTILLSNFHATKGDKTHSELPKKMTIKVDSPNHGEMKYKSLTTGIGAHSFVLIGKTDGVTVTQAGDGKLLVETTGAAKFVVVPASHQSGSVKGLTSEVKMKFQIVPFNSAGAGPISEEASTIIQ